MLFKGSMNTSYYYFSHRQEGACHVVMCFFFFFFPVTLILAQMCGTLWCLIEHRELPALSPAMI